MRFLLINKGDQAAYYRKQVVGYSQKLGRFPMVSSALPGNELHPAWGQEASRNAICGKCSHTKKSNKCSHGAGAG